MRIREKEGNRCFIFLFYDPDGRVDDCVLTLLDACRAEGRYLLAVCNGPVRPDEYIRLKEHTDEVLFRLNFGFDIGGYREALFHLGWNRLSEFDEVIMLNYTFFGPFPSFRDMFEKMDGRDLDFWGITKHHRMPEDPYGHLIPYGYMPEHLNSYFIAVRRSLFSGQAYQDFMMNLKNPRSRMESVLHYEIIFTKHFADLGYKWDTYTDSGFLEGIHYFPAFFGLKDLMEKGKCPVIKRRTFYTEYFDFLDKTAGEASAEALDYLKAHPEQYDLNPVWDNVLRLQDLADIIQTLHLKLFPDAEVTDHDFSNSRETLVAVLGEEKTFRALCGRYDRAIPGYWRRLYENGAEGFGEKLAKTAKAAGECRYVCVIDPGLKTETGKHSSDAVSLLYRDLENVCGTRAYIGNLIDELEAEKRLGMIIPPVPNHGRYFEKMEDGWAGRLTDVQSAAKKLGLMVPIRRTTAHPVFPVGGSFWIRAGILKELTERFPGLRELDDELVRMLLPYCLQEMRALTVVAMSTRYAANEATNLDFMTRENNRAVFSRTQSHYYHVVLGLLGEIRNE